MAKYRRSIKGGSFSPEQVSERGESRLQEYADRITKGLREERDAVISNRNDIANAMKENAQIESQQASTNAKIEQQNLQTKLNDIQAQNDAAMRQFEIDTKAQGQIFKEISDFSLTAGKKLQEIEIERLHEKWKGDYFEVMMLGNNAPSVKAITARLKDHSALQVEAHVKLNEAKEDGANPLEVSVLGEQVRNMSYGAKLATYNLVGKKYESFHREKFMDSTKVYVDSQGNQFTGEQAARNAERTSIVSAAAQQEFLDLAQLTGTNPALLQKSGLLDSMLAVNQRAMKTAEKAQIEDIDFKADTQNNSTFAELKTPAERKAHIEETWPDLVNRKGFKGALDYLTERQKLVDENGNPIYDEKALFSAKIGSLGGTFEEDHPTRAAEIRKTLANARDSAFRQQEQRRQNSAIQAYREIQGDLDSQLAAAGAKEDQDILATAIKGFKDRFEGYVPPQLLDKQRDILNENKQEAEEKLEAVKQLAKDGQLTQGKVLSIQDPAMREEAQKLLNEQNKTSKFGNDYQETLKALKQDAKMIAKDSLEGASSSAAVEVQLFMEKQFAAWYKEGLRQNNNNPSAALDYARRNHQTELAKSKAGDKTGLYYREYGANNGSVYPNIRKEQKRTDAVIEANKGRIENAVGSMGAAALNSPGLVMKEPDLRNLSQTHYTGGSIGQLITPEVKHAARLLKVSEMEVINRQIDAYNKFNTDKINRIQSPALDLINNARPETQRLFTDIPTFGSVNRGAATVTGNLQNYVRPSMGGGSRSVSVAYNGSPGQTAFIQTVRSVEGTSGPNGYNTVYGGAVVPQLTQMTLGELYDATKLGGTDAIPARLGGGKIPFKKDQYNSSASGALQLMPETLRGLVQNGGYSWNDVFSPQIQDRMILDLARQQGINPDKMDLNQMNKAGGIWAGLSPRYGQTNRSAEESFNIYRQFLNRNR